jgi:hypothetical protein
MLPLVAGAAATALMVLSTPALADGPLGFYDDSECYQTVGGQTDGNFECMISWSGGTGAVTATFTPGNQYSSVGVQSSGSGYAYLVGSCTTNFTVIVNATLTDSANASVSRRFYTTCFRSVP